MKLQEGRVYKRRDGVLTGPIERVPGVAIYKFRDPYSHRTYNESGEILSMKENAADLMEDVEVDEARIVNQNKPELSVGYKADKEKSRTDLLSSKWLLGVGEVLRFGATKYHDNNWRKGIATSRLMAAAQRHLLAYNDGEDLDPETGLSHLLHLSCCVMFAYELSLTKPELDDRYKEDVKT